MKTLVLGITAYSSQWLDKFIYKPEIWLWFNNNKQSMFFYYLLNIPFRSGISPFCIKDLFYCNPPLIKQFAETVWYFFVSLIDISYIAQSTILVIP